MQELGVISPCSTCKNKRDEPDPETGKPACPRLYLKRWAKTEEEAGRTVSAGWNPALLTGTEGTDQEGTDALRNPVYADENHHILIWVAKTAQNVGVWDEKDPEGKKLVAPQILDPSFKDYTEWIKCEAEPYLVQMTEADYHAGGAYREWDKVVVDENVDWQLTITDGEERKYDRIHVMGSVQKVHIAFNFPRKVVDKPKAPEGT